MLSPIESRVLKLLARAPGLTPDECVGAYCVTERVPPTAALRREVREAAILLGTADPLAPRPAGREIAA